MTDEGKPSPIRQEIERTLGRPLSAGELAPVRALPDLPEEVLATAAALPEILKIWYLRRLVDESERRNVPAFVEEVVDGDVPAAHWRRGGILLPDFTVPDLLRRDATDILAVVPTDGGAWRRYPVSREAWREGDTYVGAPAAERPDLDRRFQTPAHVTRVHTPGIVLEREEAPERLARRWIAARVARVARLTDAGAAEDPPTLVRAVLPDAGSLSADATVAVHALLRELSELGRPSDREVPGFRGPDVWYERP